MHYFALKSVEWIGLLHLGKVKTLVKIDKL